MVLRVPIRRATIPYFHDECGGQVRWFPFLPIRPRCERCGKRWPFLSVYRPQPPSDMTYEFRSPIRLQRGTTPYASWADSPYAPPGVTLVASNLPNWPRKWRFISFFGSITLMSGAFYGLYLLSFWAVVFGAIGLVVLSFIIVLLLTLRQAKT